MPRAVDWVFHHYYYVWLTDWALAREIPTLRDRTKTVCYEKLTRSDDGGASAARTVEDMLDFFYNGTNNHEPYRGGFENVTQQYAGRHATSDDAGVREELKRVVRDVDAKYYGGDIAWLDRILPC